MFILLCWTIFRKWPWFLIILMPSKLLCDCLMMYHQDFLPLLEKPSGGLGLASVSWQLGTYHFSRTLILVSVSGSRWNVFWGGKPCRYWPEILTFQHIPHKVLSKHLWDRTIYATSIPDCKLCGTDRVWVFQQSNPQGMSRESLKSFF